MHGGCVAGGGGCEISGSRYTGGQSEWTAQIEMVGAASSAAPGATATSSAFFQAGSATRRRAQALPFSTALDAMSGGFDLGSVPARQRTRRVRHRGPSIARTGTSATALKAKAIETADAMAARAQEELAEREAIEAAIREDGVPTVVSRTGFSPGEEDEEDEEEEDGGDEEEGEDGLGGMEANAVAKTLDEEEESQDREAAAIQVRSWTPTRVKRM